MPTVTILPGDTTREAASGALLMDVLLQAGAPIEAACGGQGTCGKCAVRVVSGTVAGGQSPVAGQGRDGSGWVLACRARVGDEPVVVAVPGVRIATRHGGKFAEEGGALALVPDGVIPPPSERAPLAECVDIHVAQPALEDGLGDAERVRAALGARSPASVSVECFREMALALRERGGDVSAWVERTPERSRMIGLRAGHGQSPHGIAVDIGTTTVAVVLTSLGAGTQTHTSLSDYNDQIACGLDVISRINYARREGGLDELRRRIVGTINRLVNRLAADAGIATRDIAAASISGNTTMIHLFLGLNPEHIRLEPYTPTVLRLPVLCASETALDIHPAAPVHIAPGVGSYVGGDISAGLLCTPLAGTTEELTLYVDIGTNGEIALGTSEYLLTCACSAGPAFEGGGISCGMRASTGAIDAVTVDQHSGEAVCRVIGGGPAKGICGSGMISLVTTLRAAGVLDAGGRLNRERFGGVVGPDGRRAQYQLTRAVDGALGLSVREVDIENILRAKAAVYAAIRLMLDRVGATPSDVQKVFIAGGFGRFLDIEAGIALGLLPDLPRERFTYLGNASLAGAYLCLISERHRVCVAEVASRMTYLELSTEPSYMDQYTAAMFIPHTDRSLFPTVR